MWYWLVHSTLCGWLDPIAPSPQLPVRSGVFFSSFFFLVLLFPLLLPDRFRISTTPSPSHRTNPQPNLREQVALLDCIALFQYGLGLSAAAGQAAGLGSVGGQDGNRRLDFLGGRETKVGGSRLFCGEPAVVVGSGWL